MGPDTSARDLCLKLIAPSIRRTQQDERHVHAAGRGHNGHTIRDRRRHRGAPAPSAPRRMRRLRTLEGHDCSWRCKDRTSRMMLRRPGQHAQVCIRQVANSGEHACKTSRSQRMLCPSHPSREVAWDWPMKPMSRTRSVGACPTEWRASPPKLGIEDSCGTLVALSMGSHLQAGYRDAHANWP